MEYSKTNIHLPTSWHEAAEQIAVMIKVFDLFNREQSIASQGYRWDYAYIIDHQENVENSFLADPSFLMKFLYMLDCHFQTFGMILLKKSKRKRPHGCR